MAVFERRLGPWAGPWTPRGRRFLVVARYARREVFASRLLTAFYALCFAPLLAAAGFIYLRYNLSVLQTLQIPIADLLPVDATFFYRGLQTQGFLAFLLTAFIGPGLVAPDAANNGLALIFARPLSRRDYVLGKLTVLAGVLSAVTWVPLALLVLFEGSLDAAPGLAGHGRSLLGILAGGVAWVAVLSLVALAISAWVRWKMLAAALQLAGLFVAMALGAIVNQIHDTHWGDLLNPWELAGTAWQSLFFAGPPEELPFAAAWLGLGALAASSLWLLRRKLQAYEVVR